MLRRIGVCRLVVTMIVAVAVLAAPSRVSADCTLVVQEYDSSGTALGLAQTYTGNESLGIVSTGAVASIQNDFIYSITGTENAGMSGVPDLHLDSLALTHTAASTNYLVVALSEGGSGAGYTGPTGPTYLISNLSSIANIGQASVSLTSFADSNNNLFGVTNGFNVNPPGTPFSPPLVNSSGAVGAATITMDSTNNTSGITTTTVFNSAGNYSMTQVATISGLAEDQSISFNAHAQIAPAPSALLLAMSGIPMLGFRFMRRRMRSSDAADSSIRG